MDFENAIIILYDFIDGVKIPFDIGFLEVKIPDQLTILQLK